MIFSQKKWDAAGELQPYIPIANTTSFRTFESALSDAFNLFVRPLLDRDMCIVLEELYENTEPSDKEYADPTREQAGARLLCLSQRANAILALWYDYHELNSLIDDSGVRKQEASNSNMPYKYQELAMIQSWKAKGFNALDDLLEFLERNILLFPEFKNSKNYTQKQAAIVRNTSEVDEYFAIGRSRLTFLRLKPHMKIIEDTLIAPRLGTTYRELILNLQEDKPERKFQTLREKLIPCVVFYAMRRMLIQTGDVTDKGLFFSSVTGENAAYERSQPADIENLNTLINRVQSDGDIYWNFVEDYLHAEFGQQKGALSQVPTFDNDNFKTILIV